MGWQFGGIEKLVLVVVGVGWWMGWKLVVAGVVGIEHEIAFLLELTSRKPTASTVTTSRKKDGGLDGFDLEA